jgi:glutathione S-transferase
LETFVSKLIIYGVPASRTIRALWMAHELGIPYENVPIGFNDGSNKTPDYLAINANGRIPAIKDGGFILWESMAINLYLAKKHDKGLAPKTLAEEAQTWQWCFWAMTEVEKQLITWAFNTLVYAPDKRDAKLAAQMLTELEKPLQVIDAHLKQSPYLVGNRFTVADLNVAAVMFRATKLDLGKLPNLKRWLDACFGRPAAISAFKLRE